jgi:hypothetical protein
MNFFCCRLRAPTWFLGGAPKEVEEMALRWSGLSLHQSIPSKFFRVPIRSFQANSTVNGAQLQKGSKLALGLWAGSRRAPLPSAGSQVIDEGHTVTLQPWKASSFSHEVNLDRSHHQVGW